MRTIPGALIGLVLLALAPAASAWETVTVTGPFGSVQPGAGTTTTRTVLAGGLQRIVFGDAVYDPGPDLGVARGSTLAVRADPAPDAVTVLLDRKPVTAERVAGGTYRVRVPATLLFPAELIVRYERERPSSGRESWRTLRLVPVPEAPRLR